MTIRELLYEYFVNISDQAHIEVEQLRDKRYMRRDEVDLLEEIIALTTEKTVNRIFNDVRLIMKIDTKRVDRK